MAQIQYKNITIDYTATGKGTAVVLLHGFLENQTMWQYLAPVLATKYRVITIDLLGHGNTDCLGYVHTMEDQADMVHHVLHELKIRKSVLIGHSMGGYVALAFAELYPDNVKGLVLLNSTSRADSDERKLNRDRAIAAVKQNYTAFVRMSIANLFSEDNREKLAETIENVKLEALKTPLQGIVAALEGMKIRNDREVLLHFGPYPIALILGKKDGVLPYDDNVTQVENTRVQLTSFPDGHMSHLENQKALEKTIVSFLKGI
ncbi:Pimeloyl-ACP methyl ester carboxylesterase [Flavobacterium fontis]|jgi:pimeloyl-ACP methyl ester carboxylesterase|uniref:Pimeloyl-ACP methyl ester carboxylesterase n=1 Tax=Flavobacterium fontis TaxID=1124188 RepID=A0A1M4YHA9_9FLAO|nr:MULTISPECIES: alpha/beta hydrolase [Flavobacterium]MCZ8167560.1 alpha/beta hydrolase [Flavobacterium sp.]MCZ8297867.1 alpha/beta hydrolase [Flavobacterium sp.]SHF04826.1 Pimeloyl-ACP methyl ester carboxylesterase [Flavobacterium fontis]